MMLNGVDLPAEEAVRRGYGELRQETERAASAKLRARGMHVDPVDLDAFYNQAWHALYTRLAEGESVENPAGFLVQVMFFRAVDEHRRLHPGRRADAVEVDSLADAADPEQTIDDRDRIRSFVEGMKDRLTERERQAAALCYLQGFSRPEAASVLGLSDKRMQKLMDVVSKKVGAFAQEITAGTWCESQDSLMKAYAFGLLDPEGERHQLASVHLRGCSGCRRRVLALRGLTAVVPPVALPWALLGGGGAAGGAAGAAGGHAGASGAHAGAAGEQTAGSHAGATSSQTASSQAASSQTGAAGGGSGAPSRSRRPRRPDAPPPAVTALLVAAAVAATVAVAGGAIALTGGDGGDDGPAVSAAGGGGAGGGAGAGGAGAGAAGGAAADPGGTGADAAGNRPSPDEKSDASAKERDREDRADRDDRRKAAEEAEQSRADASGATRDRSGGTAKQPDDGVGTAPVGGGVVTPAPAPAPVAAPPASAGTGSEPAGTSPAGGGRAPGTPSGSGPGGDSPGSGAGTRGPTDRASPAVDDTPLKDGQQEFGLAP